MASKQDLIEQVAKLLSKQDNPVTGDVNEGLSRLDTIELETKLKELGYHPGETGNINGNRTHSSILQFLQDNVGKYADKVSEDIQNSFRASNDWGRFVELKRESEAGSATLKQTLENNNFQAIGREVSRLQHFMTPYGYKGKFDTDFGPNLGGALMNYIQKNPKSLGEPDQYGSPSTTVAHVGYPWLEKLTELPQYAQSLKALTSKSPEFIARTKDKLLETETSDLPESAWRGAQILLKASGYYKGPVNGHDDRATVEAKNQFLREHPDPRLDTPPPVAPPVKNKGTVTADAESGSNYGATFMAAHDGIPNDSGQSGGLRPDIGGDDPGLKTASIPSALPTKPLA